MTTASATPAKPDIPPELADLPRWKNLVVPYVQVVLRDGTPDFRAVHESKRVYCIEHRLCGVCGRPLDFYIVFLAATERQMLGREYHEPALHEVCAAYTARACAMVSGRMAEYRAAAHRSDGQPCSDPECECAGWVAHGPRRVEPRSREPWWWVRTRGYRVRRDRSGAVVAYAERPVETRCLG